MDSTQDQKIIQQEIDQLLTLYGKDPTSFEGSLASQMIWSALRLLAGDHDTGQIKLINRAIKEMRYGFRIFNKYHELRMVSMFGSARTPEDHPDYEAAKKFGSLMAKEHWMCITGGANGIMKAGIEGSTKDSSFGLSIRLPFESSSNTVIEGDPKLIFFRYFFTRKLMFLSQSDAVAVFPGGFGTLDELFEVLTLMQTGKAAIVPVVLIEGGNGYWEHWEHYLDRHLFSNGWISPEDRNFYRICETVEEGVLEIKQFYRRYHSSRYVGDLLVIRMLSDISDDDLLDLNGRFSDIVALGNIEKCKALEGESDFQELPRLCFHFTRKMMARLRLLIDAINAFS